jgi:hypothetical protein
VMVAAGWSEAQERAYRCSYRPVWHDKMRRLRRPRE